MHIQTDVFVCKCQALCYFELSNTRVTCQVNIVHCKLSLKTSAFNIYISINTCSGTFSEKCLIGVITNPVIQEPISIWLQKVLHITSKCFLWERITFENIVLWAMENSKYIFNSFSYYCKTPLTAAYLKQTIWLFISLAESFILKMRKNTCNLSHRSQQYQQFHNFEFQPIFFFPQFY